MADSNRSSPESIMPLSPQWLIARPSDRAGTTNVGADASLGGPGEELLEITVADPVKQGDGVQAYVSYRVNTKTNLPNYRRKEFSVIRRFSDFLWLHERLTETHRGVIIPPLPEKNVVEKFRFSADFIDMRRQALDMFINRVAAHPLLRQSSDLQLFLEASEDLWSLETARAHEANLLKKKPSDFMQLFRDVQAKVGSMVLGKDKAQSEVDEEYESLKSYVAALETHLAEARKQAERLVKRQRDLGQALADFGIAVLMLGDCEGGSLGHVFKELGKRSDALSAASQKQAQELTSKLEQPLREYVRMILSIKHVMSDRQSALSQWQQGTAELASKRVKLERLKQAQPPVRAERIAEMDAEIEECKKREEELKRAYEVLVETMHAEMVRFQQQKTQDLATIMRNFALAQARLADETAKVWQSLLPDVQNLRKPAVGGDGNTLA
ncbi:hypothetical protein CBR_g20439 [Chara braunii]|uniref:PX domain-containing protein n=1 Tax=Chara braunii TaxID=69332 RepID=A0A388JUC9_CHABU|nr:hypothetical protein CBR_g20439 [Chara braunii]|eukprot:GBG61408.1 hypothetical protein CBR_g20439 [Chara braunii]